ncbi:MAG: recombinase family protein [Mycobacterium leprae]
MTTAALYVRVSTEDQARHGYSLAAQVEACRTRAEALGATAIRLFADEGVSGALLVRPGLDGLRSAVKGRAVDLVVVWDPDRLSRNLSHQLLVTEEIEQAGVRLEFVNFEWKNTPEGQLFYALRGAIAQYEKEKIRERTGRGRLQKAKQGQLPLAFRPYGYDYDPATALLLPNPPEAAVLRQLFTWCRTEGMGPNGIARRLNQLGIPARKGGQWHRAVVRQILANPVYTGTFYTNRWNTAGCSLNRHRPPAERLQARERPLEQWVPVAVPALVTTEEWEEVQALLQRARRLWAGQSRAEYLLSGLLECGRCNHAMAGFMGTDWGVKRRKYTCRRTYAGAAAGWCGRTVEAEGLEAAVWRQVLDWLAEPELLLQAMRVKPQQSDQLRAELTEVEQGMAKAEAGRANLLTLLEGGMLAAAEGADRLARVQQRLAALAERRRLLLAELAEGETALADTEESAVVEAALRRFHEGALSLAERKWLVRSMITRVVVMEERLVLHARWPAAFAPAFSARQREPTGKS